MPIERLRNVGKVGILTDPDPYDLPMEAFSAGVNVRFRNNKVTGAPVFRDVLGLGTVNPRFLYAASPTNSANELFIGYQNGTITSYSNGAETNYTLSGYTPSAVEAYWSGTTLDGLVYINRSDRNPWYLLPTASAFANLGYTAPGGITLSATTSTSSPTVSCSGSVASLPIGTSVYSGGLWLGYVASVVTSTITLSANCAVVVSSGAALTFSGFWDSSWSTILLRQCSNALVALNVSKGATSYPQMVKTSSPVTSGQTPASWDINQANTLATENIIGSMDGPITDAQTLGQDLIIYGRREAWRMHADGSIEVYAYAKLPFKKGALNANCSVELDGKNYVFGMDDIWVHDGVTEQSICDQQVRDYIFSSLNMAQAFKCFVTYNPRLNEIYFAYVSGDAYVNFLSQNGIDGCNRSAVYNITNDTWTFDDLPSIWSAAYAPLPNFQTYSTTYTYTTIGGSYQDQEDGDKRVVAMVGDANTTYSLTTQLYAFDIYGVGSIAAFPVDSNATAPRYLERIGFDMNELNTELRGYKTLSTIYPQARVDTSGGSYMLISVGASDNISDLTTSNWSPWMQYDGDTNYKLDFNIAGRWLGMRIQWPDYRALTITGFDYDIRLTGNR